MQAKINSVPSASRWQLSLSSWLIIIGLSLAWLGYVSLRNEHTSPRAHNRLQHKYHLNVNQLTAEALAEEENNTTHPTNWQTSQLPNSLRAKLWLSEILTQPQS